MMRGLMTRQVVLLHGFTHTGASWRPVARALGERYRALAPDIRGHGSASDRRPADLAGVLEDLTGVISPRATLVGYSMGGRLALHAALAQTPLIQRLVLIGASPGLAEASKRRARRLADQELAGEIETMTIERFARLWAQTPVLAGLPDEVAQRVHQDRLRNTPAGLAAALRGLGTGVLPSVWGRLGELSMPVTLVVGARDHKFQAIAAEMARALPHGEVVVVSGAGHAVHLEVPEHVAQLIAAAPPAGPR